MPEIFVLQGVDQLTGEECDVELSSEQILTFAARLRAQQEGGTGSLAEVYVDDLEDLPPAI